MARRIGPLELWTGDGLESGVDAWRQQSLSLTGKLVRYRYRGQEVSISRESASGNTLTFGSDTFTIEVTFSSDRIASAHYRNHNNGDTSSATLTRQWP